MMPFKRRESMDILKHINPQNYRIAFYSETDELTVSYSDVFKNIEQFNKQLLQEFKTKSVGLIIAHQDLASICFYLACLKYNHAVLLIDPQMSKADRQRLQTTYNSDWIFDRSFKNLQVKHGNNIHPELAVLISTSGSLGSAKSVRLSQKNLTSNCLDINVSLGLDSSTSSFLSLPWSYAFGLSVLHTHLSVGSKIFLSTKSLLNKDVLISCANEDIQCIYGSPFTLDLICKTNWKILPKSCRKLAIAGGQIARHLQAQAGEFCQARQIEFFSMYGQTEAAARITILSSDMALKKLGSCGKAIGKIKLEINPENSEILISGENIMMGYANSINDLEKPPAIQKLPTGDIGFLDDEGYLYIKGRLKRIAKIYSQRIQLDELGEKLSEICHFEVVASEADDFINLFIEKDSSIEVLTHAMQQFDFLYDKYQILSLPGLFPRSENGKLKYGELTNCFRSKNQDFFSEVCALHNHHLLHCELYQIYDKLIFGERELKSFEDLTWIPARLFKSEKLVSVNDSSRLQSVQSSGTGNKPSIIYLDSETSRKQKESLIATGKSFLGSQRLPMLILSDYSTPLSSFNASQAAAAGFMLFGYDYQNFWNSGKMITITEFEKFLTAHPEEKILVFGFTSIVWTEFYPFFKSLPDGLKQRQFIIVHGGGWKQLQEKKVSDQHFNESFCSVGNVELRNYYGLTEQLGNVFFECDFRRLHVPKNSFVLIRDPNTLRPVPDLAEGLIHLFSSLPRSYPGHSLLTEDLGKITGVDVCPCGRKGQTVAITGRLAESETRGCANMFPGGLSSSFS